MTSHDTRKEGNFLSKNSYKLILVFLKVIPVLLVLFDITNTVLGFLGVECYILSLIGGISLLPLMFIYLASYVFRFCRYHRMFLHYILVTNVLSAVDLTIGLPVTTAKLFAIHCVLIAVFLFLVLYFYMKRKEDAGYHKDLFAEDN